MEYELLGTGVFNEDRYFDVFVEFAKQSPEDILIQISVSNRGSEPVTLQVLPTLWFAIPGLGGLIHPSHPKQVSGQKGGQAIAASHADLSERFLYCEGDIPLLFTETRDQQRAALRYAQCVSLCQRRNQQLRNQRKS
jgi:hypothetical protein